MVCLLLYMYLCPMCVRTCSWMPEKLTSVWNLSPKCTDWMGAAVRWDTVGLQAVHSSGCKVWQLYSKDSYLSNWVHVSDSVVADHPEVGVFLEVVRLHLRVCSILWSHYIRVWHATPWPCIHDSDQKLVKVKRTIYIFEYCPTVVLYNILDHGNKYHVASTRAPLSAIYAYATKSVWIVRASFIALPYMWKGLCVLLGLLTEPANKCHAAQEHHPALRECHLLRAVYNGSECVLQHKIMM